MIGLVKDLVKVDFFGFSSSKVFVNHSTVCIRKKSEGWLLIKVYIHDCHLQLTSYVKVHGNASLPSCPLRALSFINENGLFYQHSVMGEFLFVCIYS